MLRARIIAHPRQNTASLRTSLEQSGYKVEQLRPDEKPHHDAHLEINLTDGSFEWTEPDIAAEAPTVEATEPAVVREPGPEREFILAPLFREARETWAAFRNTWSGRGQKAGESLAHLRERARGGAAIVVEGASVVGELSANALKQWKLKMDAAAKSAADRADAWKQKMERKREMARRERAERELFAVPPPKPKVVSPVAPVVSEPKFVAPDPVKYEPIVEPLQAERVTELVNEEEKTSILHSIYDEEETKVMAAAAGAGSDSRPVSSRERDWRNSMTIAAGLTLAFLIGWSIGTRDEAPISRDADVAAEVAIQPAVVSPTPVAEKKVVAESKPVATPAAKPKPVAKRRAVVEEDDVDVIAEDVVVRHYPSVSEKYAQNRKQSGVKRISDID